MNQNLLLLAGILSAVASIAHIGIVFGGSSWYRFFGAGERMAKLAEQKSILPTLVTLALAALLGIWALYAWSGAGYAPKLPLVKPVLTIITSIYLIRGLGGLIGPHISNHPAILSNSKSFWFWSSAICLSFGFVHLLGVAILWSSL